MKILIIKSNSRDTNASAIKINKSGVTFSKIVQERLSFHLGATYLTFGIEKGNLVLLYTNCGPKEGFYKLTTQGDKAGRTSFHFSKGASKAMFNFIGGYEISEVKDNMNNIFHAILKKV